MILRLRKVRNTEVLRKKRQKNNRRNGQDKYNVSQAGGCEGAAEKKTEEQIRVMGKR